MDKTAMLRWLVPGLLAGGLIVLLGVLISLSDFGPETPDTSAEPNGSTVSGPSSVPADSTGMSDPTAAGLPPVDAAGWRPGPGGMKIWDVTEGEGAPVPEVAKVYVHYTGWLKDGTVFDSSVARDEPIEFGLDQVISGWTKGIPGMKPGGVRRLQHPVRHGIRGARQPAENPDPGPT